MKVCLHCRHEERELARARRRQLAGRIGTAALGLTVLAIAGAAGATALQNRQGSASASARSVETSRGDTASPERRQPPVQQVATAQQGVAATPVAAVTPSTAAATAANATQPPLAPIIAEGRTELVEGMYALRAGGNIEVHFDTPATRTRRADKFERIVRTTLPLVYGAAADSLLANTPPGRIATAERLLTELPATGVRLALASGWSLVLHPGTRPGQDGPLVVTYRAIVTR